MCVPLLEFVVTHATVTVHVGFIKAANRSCYAELTRCEACAQTVTLADKLRIATLEVLTQCRREFKICLDRQEMRLCGTRKTDSKVGNHIGFHFAQ